MNLRFMCVFPIYLCCNSLEFYVCMSVKNNAIFYTASSNLFEGILFIEKIIYKSFIHIMILMT